MKLFKFRKKRNKFNDSSCELSKLYYAKDYDAVVLKAFDLRNNNQEISSNDKQMIALSYFYIKDYENSLVIFKEIAKEKNDLESWFNCLNPLLLTKQMSEAKEVFNKLIHIHKGISDKQPRELAIPYIRYYYACGLNDAGLFDEALEQLEELKKIYMKAKITDDTFLYIRGIPFIYNTLDLARKVFTSLSIDFTKSKYLSELKSQVDNEGKNIIEKYEI